MSGMANRLWNEAPRLTADGSGLWCDEDGVRLGHNAWLVRRVVRQGASGGARYRRLSHGEIGALLDAAYGTNAIAADRVVRALDAVIRALEADAPARAILAATFLGLPHLDAKGLARLERTATLVKAGFDPNQPRDDHGRWTDEDGDGTADETAPSPGPVQVASATPETMSDATQVAVATHRHWEHHPNPEFRQALARAERSAEHKNHGYQERSKTSNALGRYQMTRSALIAAGMKSSDGKWTGKYGIRSDQEFLADPEAQELALTDFLADNDRQLVQYGSKSFIGRSIDGKEGRFTITEAGLAGAAHRHGPPSVRRYLAHQQRNGWRSDFSTLPDKQRKTFIEIETRMRTFSNTPYRPPRR